MPCTSNILVAALTCKLPDAVVDIPLNTEVVNVAVVSVLFVSVSVVALPTKVSVDVGRVNVPVLLMVEITVSYTHLTLPTKHHV